MKGKVARALVLSSIAASFFISGCGTWSTTASLPSATVTITSPSAEPTLDQGQSVNITGIVTGNVSNHNITWSIMGCTGAGGSCGTLTGATASSVTYTAPAPLPTTMTVTVEAAWAANPLISAILRINDAAVTVTITDKVSEMDATTLPGQGYFQPFPAPGFDVTVANDPSNGGFTWTLTASGAPCSPACGTFKAIATSPIDSFVQYTPPASVPSVPDNTPTITATSVTDPTKSDSDTFTLFDGAAACGTQGSESMLNGQYAILLQGFGGSDGQLPNGQPAPAGTGIGNATVYTAVFDADGTGKVTGGQDGLSEVFSFGGSGFTGASLFGSPVLPSASSYSVGPDGRGCLVLTDSFGLTERLRFSLGGATGATATKGDAILSSQQEEWDPLSAAGILRLQEPSAFSLAALASNYAMGVDGWENSNALLTHFAIVGSFAQSAGTVSNQVFAGNDGGKLQGVGQYYIPNAPNGTIQTASTQFGTANAIFNGLPDPAPPTVIYAQISIIIINPSELFVVGFGGTSSGFGSYLFSGRAIATASSFSSSSISPKYIFRLTGSASGAATASIGTMGFAGSDSGTVSGALDQFSSGNASSSSITEDYRLLTNTGETDIGPTNGGVSQVLFLTNPADGISGFMMGADAGASLGVAEAQPNVSYSNSSLSGNFFFGSKEPGDNTVQNTSGTASVSSGNLEGTGDMASLSGFTLGTTFSAPVTINADGTGNLGPNSVAVTNGAKLFYINEAAGAPAAVQVFEP